MNEFPVGTIILWENATIPAGWTVCDGNNGTPDLRNKFIRGISQDVDLRVTGGSATHAHTNPNTGTRDSHNHGGSKTAAVGGSGSAIWVTSGTGTYAASVGHGHSDVGVGIDSQDSHNHTTPATDSAPSLPEHIKRVFIMRVI